MKRHRVGIQKFVHLFHHIVKVGAGAIHFINKSNAWHAVAVGLVPYGFALRLYTSYGAKHRYHPVDDAQRALHLDGKIDVPRRVDDVDVGIFPMARDSRRSDGDATFLLLLHKIHGGLTVVGFAKLAGSARKKKDAFCNSGFSGIDVGCDADIS